MEVIDEIMDDEEQYDKGALCLNWSDIPDPKNQDRLLTDREKVNNHPGQWTR